MLVPDPQAIRRAVRLIKLARDPAYLFLCANGARSYHLKIAMDLIEANEFKGVDYWRLVGRYDGQVTCDMVIEDIRASVL